MPGKHPSLLCSQGLGSPRSAGAGLAGSCVAAAAAWLPWVKLPWLEELYSPGSRTLCVAYAKPGPCRVHQPRMGKDGL